MAPPKKAAPVETSVEETVRTTVMSITRAHPVFTKADLTRGRPGLSGEGEAIERVLQEMEAEGHLGKAWLKPDRHTIQVFYNRRYTAMLAFYWLDLGVIDQKGYEEMLGEFKAQLQTLQQARASATRRTTRGVAYLASKIVRDAEVEAAIQACDEAVRKLEEALAYASPD